MATPASRTYTSPLREDQSRRTRALILEAFTELLADRRADDITTKDIAARAGVSQPTVYRHFPDREALLRGLTLRLGEVADIDGLHDVSDLSDLGRRMETLFVGSDTFATEMRAEVLLNSDPRHYTPETRQHSAETLALVAAAFPDLDAGRHTQIAGLLRCLGSSQSWLRMREEFGVPGAESGPLVRWAIDLILDAVRRGELPDIPKAPKPSSKAEPT